jgi:hypothetical protein
MIIKQKTLILILSIVISGTHSLFAMHHPTYDTRNVAVLAYGSLINQPTGATGKTLHASRFQDTGFGFPVELKRISSKNTDKERVTRVIDRSSQDLVPVWYATSELNSLPDARKDLAQREGSGDDLTNIYYMKTLLPGKRPDSNEEHIKGTWYARNNAKNILSQESLGQIADWAGDNGFNAIIWASFPSNASLNEIRSLLRSKTRTRNNTKEYIANLPAPLTSFEEEIQSM